MGKSADFSSKLLNWWDPNQFSYPWRNTHNPYKILISEFLLRKTTRKQVEKRYIEFFSKYPCIEALYETDIESLEKILKPLGMQHIKAKALKKLAHIIIHEHNKRIPNQRHLLENLPNVGRYITNAVLCLAFEKEVPLLDTNMIRVITRIFSLKSSRKRFHEDEEMWNFAASLIPKNRCKEFNLAILDLAASFCLPKKPRCEICPILSTCDYGNEFIDSIS